MLVTVPAESIPCGSVVPLPTPTGSGTRIGYVLDGQEFQARNNGELLVNVLEQLSRRDPGFLERFAARRHGRIRRYVAKTAEELFPGKPELVRTRSHRLSSGWWAAKYPSKKRIVPILQMASEVAGLQFGSELIVYLG